MDPLSDVLSLLHVESAVSRRIEAGGQWAIRSSRHKHVVFGALLNGPCWLIADHLDRPMQMAAGDCFLVTDGSTFRISSDLTADAVDGGTAAPSAVPSVLRLGNGAETSLIGAQFTFDELYGRVLLSFLPPTIYVRSDSNSAESLRAILHRLGEEIDARRLGSDLVVNHLAHIALVQALRASLACDMHSRKGWLGALSDYKIGTSLRMMHGDVTRRWSLAELAAAVGMSRSSFAQRFKTLVGLPPLDYLLQWRMHLAARTLRGSNKSISLVASDLGYESESAFSNAFKRIMGCSPKAFRTMENTVRRGRNQERSTRDSTEATSGDSTAVSPGGTRLGTNGVGSEHK